MKINVETKVKVTYDVEQAEVKKDKREEKEEKEK